MVANENVKAMKEPLYVVTAVNRLTGEREPISAPHQQWKAVELMRKRQAEMYRRRYQPWQKMRVEPVSREGSLW